MLSDADSRTVIDDCDDSDCDDSDSDDGSDSDDSDSDGSAMLTALTVMT